MARIVWALIALVCLADSAWAQCATPTGALFVLTGSNHEIRGMIPGFSTVFNGAPAWTGTDVYVFAKGDNPAASMPVASMTAARGEWAAVPGSPDCYRLATVGAFLFGVQPNTEYDAYVRLTNGTQKGVWSNPVPFGRPGPPPAVTGATITPSGP